MTEDDKEIIDNCFYVCQKRWETWDSYDLEDKCIITSLTKEGCINATRFYLKQKQEGQFEETKTYESTVQGKL
jgi:hypothetical protein